jgi:hypothetical protein
METRILVVDDEPDVVSGLAGRKLAVSRSVPVIDKPIDEERLLAEVRKALQS